MAKRQITLHYGKIPIYIELAVSNRNYFDKEIKTSILSEEFLCCSSFWKPNLYINPLNAELNPIRHLLALVGARHIVHVSRIRVKYKTQKFICCGYKT
jgi:hypothetical protein